MNKLLLYPTPVFVFELSDMAETNAELARLLLAEQAASPGVERSNVGGWHSAPTLAERPEACFQRLLQSLVEHVNVAVSALAEEIQQRRCSVHAWAMIMRPGDYTILHDHGDAHWSSAYYVDAGDTEVAGHPQSGLLALVDPRRGGRAVPGLDRLSAPFLVRPQSGRLVIFPGWLQHYVHPYRGERPRISISANVIVLPTSSS